MTCSATWLTQVICSDEMRSGTKGVCVAAQKDRLQAMPMAGFKECSQSAGRDSNGLREGHVFTDATQVRARAFCSAKQPRKKPVWASLCSWASLLIFSSHSMPTLVIARVFSNALFTIEVQSLPASAALTSLLEGNHVEQRVHACTCVSKAFSSC